jgi:hypothetical protein
MMDTTPTLTGDPWDTMGTWRYGLDPILRAGGHAQIPHVEAGANPGTSPFSPQHPLFWLGLVMLGTGLGLFGLSGSVKVGKTKVAASVGEG